MSLISILSRIGKRGATLRRATVGVEELEPRQLLSTTPLVVLAQADTYLEAAYPTKTHGESTTLRAKLSPDQESLFRFAVTGLSGTVQSAKLRAYVYGDSDDGPRIYATSTNWSEATVTWNTRPARQGGPLDDKGAVPIGWVEYDVTAAQRSTAAARSSGSASSTATRAATTAPSPTPFPPPTACA